jgi:hypothetical protein
MAGLLELWRAVQCRPRAVQPSIAKGISVPSSNDQQPTGAGPSDDLTGLDILLVEDSRDVGEAVKQLLELLGATVAGRHLDGLWTASDSASRRN